MQRECIPARAFVLGPNNAILLFTPWEISEQNPAFLHDSRGKLLFELRPREAINFSSPVFFSPNGTLYGFRCSDADERRRSLSLLELTLEPQPRVQVVRDLTEIIEHGTNNPSARSYWIGLGEEFAIIMENRTGSAALGKSCFFARGKARSGPISFEELPDDVNTVLGMFSDGTAILRHGSDALYFSSPGCSPKIVQEKELIRAADHALAGNFHYLYSRTAVLPGDRTAFVSSRKNICVLIMDRRGRKLTSFDLGKKTS